MDLFSRLEPRCGDCHQLGEKPLDSGIRYCWGELTWRWAEDRVAGCPYRERPRYRAPYVDNHGTHADAIKDLLESPRHSISAKDRCYLTKKLRALSSASPIAGESSRDTD